MPTPIIIGEPDLDSYNVGRVGENLAAYYLEYNGFECTVVDRRGADIWCQAPNGQMFSLEVKSVYKQPTEKNTKAFRIAKKEADQFMLMCLETNLFRIFDKATLQASSYSDMFRLKNHDFTVELMQDDMSRLLSTYS